MWRRVGTDFDTGWARVGPQMLAVTSLAQQRVSAGALDYIPAVLEDTGQVGAIDQVASARTAPLIGATGDGRPVETLLQQSVVKAKVAVDAGVPAFAALEASGDWLSLAVGTLLSDTARQAESLRIGTSRSPVGGYVRMLNPPSCSRCVLLAGKRFKRNTGFLRHPGCDCRHIPASESVAGDLTVDARSYFESLSPEDQARVFTNAGAEAIRAGADINQVVNARRGMTKSQRGRLIRDENGLYTTTEGTTSRGWAFRRLKAGGTREDLAGTAMRLTSDGPAMRVVMTTRAQSLRLMPESISEIAQSREEYLSLLKMYGYIP